MDIIKEEVFRKQMKKGLSGAYLFFGEEDYLKTHALRSAREAVCADPTFALFNDFHLDAMDYTSAKLLDALVPPPMMSDMKIVSVSGLAISSMRQSELDDLCEVLSALSEYDYNVLIISVPSGLIEEGNLPKYPSATIKKLSEYLTPVQFDAIPVGRLSSWVGKHFEHHGVVASPEVCSFLIEYAGRSMYVLSSETEKLAYYCIANGRSEVTKEDVINVSISEIGTDAFSLANSILDGKFDEAIDALAVMKFRRVEPVIILSEVSRVLCELVSIKSLMESGMPQGEIARLLKMNEYKVKIYMNKASGKPMPRLRRAIELCSEADLSLKLSPLGYTAIEKLICSL
jgi:DNA polymerase III delta subunit